MQITEVLLFLVHVHCTVNFVLHPCGSALNYLGYAVESTMLLLNNWHNYGKWDCALRQILSEVEIIMKKQYPDYELAATCISHYHDMKMVTFAVDQQTHSLVIVYPAFIKDYKQPPLALFEIESNQR